MRAIFNRPSSLNWFDIETLPKFTFEECLRRELGWGSHDACVIHGQIEVCSAFVEQVTKARLSVAGRPNGRVLSVTHHVCGLARARAPYGCVDSLAWAYQKLERASPSGGTP